MNQFFWPSDNATWSTSEFYDGYSKIANPYLVLIWTKGLGSCEFPWMNSNYLFICWWIKMRNVLSNCQKLTNKDKVLMCWCELQQVFNDECMKRLRTRALPAPEPQYYRWSPLGDALPTSQSAPKTRAHARAHARSPSDLRSIVSFGSSITQSGPRRWPAAAAEEATCASPRECAALSSSHCTLSETERPVRFDEGTESHRDEKREETAEVKLTGRLEGE